MKSVTEMNNFKEQLNLEDAQKFLEKLGGSTEEVHTFQSFDDDQSLEREQKRGWLTKMITGTFEQVKEELIELNRKGAGIFVTVNKTDDEGRKAENIIALRALFADKDEGDLPALKIEPSILVQSKRGLQPYFVLVQNESLEKFTPAQAALAAHLASDPKIKDLCRVMRLPGFLHLKEPNDPFLVRLVSVSDKKYSVEEVLEAYPPAVPAASNASAARSIKNIKNFDSWVQSLPVGAGSTNELGGRNNTVLLLVREGLGQGLAPEALRSSVVLYCDRSGLERSVGLEIFERQSAKHKEKKFKSFLKENGKLSAYEIAGAFLENRGYSSAEALNLRAYNKIFYAFDGKKYVTLAPHVLESEIMRFLQGDPRLAARANGKLVNDVIKNLEGICFIASEPMPFFISDSSKAADNLISLENGLLDVDAWIENGNVILSEHTSDFFSLSNMPLRLDDEAKCPRWLEFLEQVIPDSGYRAMLQEWYGYNLIHSVSYQKFLIMHGEGANGKSVICTVLRTLLGDENVSAVGLEAFDPARTFPLSATIGKLANIVEEVGDLDKAAEGLLKLIVSGGLITVERKFVDPVSVCPTVRLTFATNVLPRFRDRSDGVWRRLMLLPMTFQVLDVTKQDSNLVDPKWWRNSGELPGILRWSLEGLRRLHQNKGFTEATASSAAKSDFRLDANPAAQFLSEHVTIETGNKLCTSELYWRYHNHAKSHGHLPLANVAFASEVRRVFPMATQTKNAVWHQGKRARQWLGIALKDKAIVGTTDTTSY